MSNDKDKLKQIETELKKIAIVLEQKEKVYGRGSQRRRRGVAEPLPRGRRKGVCGRSGRGRMFPPYAPAVAAGVADDAGGIGRRDGDRGRRGGGGRHDK